MAKTKADRRSIELVKMISRLRDHIDVHRIVGLNAAALKRSGISRNFLAYLQISALEALAIYLCKIFEASARHELNSIPGIIDTIPRMRLSPKQRAAFAAFGEKYGNYAEPVEAKAYLDGTFGLVCGLHAVSLARLKEFRNKVGAHSDAGAAIRSLPSHGEFELMAGFAEDFYELIAGSLHDGGPDIIRRRVGRGLVRLLGNAGVADVKYDFEDGS